MQGVAFWKSYMSKSERNNRAVTQVNGLSDACTVAERFATHVTKSNEVVNNHLYSPVLVAYKINILSKLN